jgi:hypothetical protein
VAPHLRNQLGLLVRDRQMSACPTPVGDRRQRADVAMHQWLQREACLDLIVWPHQLRSEGRMRRREFICLINTVAASPIAARAQLLGKNPAVGVLHPGQAETMPQRLTAVREGLSRSHDQGNQAIDLVIRLADGNLSRLPALATELVEARVDAILAAGPPSVQAARGATDHSDHRNRSGDRSRCERFDYQPWTPRRQRHRRIPGSSRLQCQMSANSRPALPAIGVLWDPTTGSLQLEAVQAAASRYGSRSGA